MPIPRKLAMVEVMEDGDIKVFDFKGEYVSTADVRPFAFGGTGLDGLISAIQHAVNHIPEHRTFIIPIKGADPGTEREIAQRRMRSLYENAHKKAPSQRSRAQYARVAQPAPAADIDFSDLGI